MLWWRRKKRERWIEGSSLEDSGIRRRLDKGSCPAGTGREM